MKSTNHSIRSKIGYAIDAMESWAVGQLQGVPPEHRLEIIRTIKRERCEDRLSPEAYVLYRRYQSAV